MRRRVLPLVAALLVAGLAACGGEEEKEPLPEAVEGTVPTTTTATTTNGSGAGKGDPEAGKEVFAGEACGSCHVLSDAGTSGTIGPNLDDAKPDFELVVERVTNGKGVMPSFKDKLSEEQIQDVAAYVSQATSG